MSDVPSPPDGLGPAGARFWTDTVTTHELAPHELVILGDACHEIDLIARLEAAAKDSDLVVMGSQRQPVISPLVPELRAHRTTLANLIKALRFGDAAPVTTAGTTDGVVVPMTRTEIARKAANVRWGNG